MKKIISLFAIIAMMFSMTLTAFGGSIPEEMLNDDNAQLFFAEVVYYHPNKENPDIELSPVKVIKGDVKTGGKLTYYNPNPVGDFKVKEGNVYLFTYFNEDNPTDIFEVTSYDTSKLKIKHVSGDMWERFEKYLNEGRYLDAEHKRIDMKNRELVTGDNTVSLSDYLNVDDASLGTISIYSGPRGVEAERAEFIRISDGIFLKEVKKDDIAIESGYGYHISSPENMEFVYISSDGKVGKNNPKGNVLKNTEYVMESSDIAKIEQFFEENKIELPPLESPYARYIVYGVLIGALVGGGIGAIIGFLIKKKRKSK